MNRRNVKREKIERFQRIVWSHYKKHGRHDLPWRQTKNPYSILVSEVMLQQTQVGRVVPYYKAFLKQFPTVRALSRAPLSSALRAWQGLGYNRRAKMLHQASKSLINGFPRKAEELEKLPGIGPYTARAICAFAFNQEVVFVETNIRTAVMHHFFPKRKKISDTDIARILVQALPKGKSRAWYSALMDYGAYLKSSGVRVNAKSKGYTKQSKFVGSDREIRGALLRVLAKGSKDARTLANMLGTKRAPQARTQLKRLLTEGFIEKRASQYRLAR